jgi:hypothetical protein
MSDLTGCNVGSDCPITFGPDPWMALVCEKLCEQGLNCGRHDNEPPGATDQISVKQGSFCDGQLHENYQIYNYGGKKVRWAPGGKQDGWYVECEDTQPPPSSECVDPDPRGLPAEFVLHCGQGNGTVCDSTYRVRSREYCDAVCSPLEPDVCFTGRNACPMRMEGDPERHVCYNEVVAPQQWWCDGQPIDPLDHNPARARCVGLVKTCTADGETCSTKDAS